MTFQFAALAAILSRHYISVMTVFDVAFLLFIGDDGFRSIVLFELARVIAFLILFGLFAADWMRRNAW
jgi:hypothetical protein